jgi:hypothetical protein
MFSGLDRLTDQDQTTKESSINMVNNFFFLLDDQELLKCFLNLPVANGVPFAFDLAHLAHKDNNKIKSYGNNAYHIR